MFELIKGFFKILTFDIDKLGDDISKRLEEIAGLEDNEKRRYIMLKGYRLGYEFKTTERICDVAFKLGVDTDTLLLGLAWQKTILLSECGLSVRNINDACEKLYNPLVWSDKDYMVLSKEDYAKAILDYLEKKHLEK